MNAKRYGSSFQLAVTAGVVVLLPVMAFAQQPPVAPGVNNIAPDGRTATKVATDGNVTSITTGTLRQGTGFNSFSHFQVGQGSVANLIVPDGAANLVNLVRDSQVYIGGIVSSYKDGKIGGNVFFADPLGFVIGSSGVINTGSLSVVTPSRAFMDGVIGPNGDINGQAASQLMSGDVPLSPNGSVVIRGKVNTLEGARLIGQTVTVGSDESKTALAHASRFASSVNSADLRTGAAIVASGGSIKIVAEGDARINGKLTASAGSVSVAARNVSMGKRATVAAKSKIDVSSLEMIAIHGGARFSAASASGDAGSIRVMAGVNLDVASGARFDVSAKGGDAGQIELSAKKVATIGSIAYDLSAVGGKAGSLLYDPEDLVIAGDPGGGETGNQITNGGSVTLQADHSITIAATGLIDTRVFNRAAGELSATNASTGDSGSVTLKAPIITIAAGSQILTDVINASAGSFTAGAISLLATDGVADRSITVAGTLRGGAITLDAAMSLAETSGPISSPAQILIGEGAIIAGSGDVTISAHARSSVNYGATNASAIVTIAGSVGGANVSVQSDAVAQSAFYDDSVDFAGSTGQLFASSLSGLAGGYVGAKAVSEVLVVPGAVLMATGNLTLKATGSEEASDRAVVLTTTRPIAASVVVGIIKETLVTVDVASGATLYAGQDLVVKSANKAVTDITAQAFSTKNTPADVTVAVSMVGLTTRATLSKGVVIQHAGNISVIAENANSFVTSAQSIALDNAKAGLAIGYAEIDTKAIAQLGSDVPIDAGVANISVIANSEASNNGLFSSASVGNGIESLLLRPVAFVVSGAGDFFASKMTAGMPAMPNVPSMKNTPTLAGALSLTQKNSQSATASIEPAVTIDGSFAINASGNVALISHLQDAALRNIANSAVDTEAQNGDKTTTISVAVALGTFEHDSNAFIGSGASISAANIGVSATTVTPITNRWESGASLSDVLDHIGADLGIANTILTSNARALSASTSLGFAGAVNYLEVDNNTVAWVGSGARLKQTSTNDASTSIKWTTTPDAGPVVDWSGGLDVRASTDTQSINIAGDFDWLKFWNIAGSTGAPSSVSVGGSANVNLFSSHTIAGVADSVVVNAAGVVSVNARTEDLVFAVAPSSGQGGGLAMNGIASAVVVANLTSASISNTAQITSPVVNVAAEQVLSTFSVSGALNLANAQKTVGMSVALAQVDAKTSAFVGANAGEIADTPFTTDDAGAAAKLANPGINTGSLNVAADVAGRMTTVAVAAEEASTGAGSSSGSTSGSPSNESYSDSILTFFGGFASGAHYSAVQSTGATKYSNFRSSITNAYRGLAGTSVQGPAEPVEPSVAVAGSASIAMNALETRAFIDAAFVTPLDSGANQTIVSAINHTISDSASGAGALQLAKPLTTGASVAIGGAIALGFSDNVTSAAITNSDLSGADKVVVQALSGGAQTIIGLGLAVSTATNGKAASASVSYGDVKDSVTADITDSSIFGVAGDANRSVSVTAYQSENIGIGGGSLYVGRGGGFGLALTYADIENSSGGVANAARITGSSLSDFDMVSVWASDRSRVAAGAALAGGGPSSDSLAGSFVIANISRKTDAEISADPTASKTISVSRSLLVSATGDVNAALDLAIGTAGTGAASNEAGFDFAAADLSPGSSTGAAIVSVAGFVQAGNANFGVSVVKNAISVSHSSLLSGVQVNSSNSSVGPNVTVQALQGGDILGVAIGVGVAVGNFAGTGSGVWNEITDTTSAQVSNRADLKASNLIITATDESSIRGAASSLSIGVGATAIAGVK